MKSTGRRRITTLRRAALALLVAAIPVAKAVKITVPANDPQILQQGQWSSTTFSASGKVNGSDSSVCSPGTPGLSSQLSGSTFTFAFIGVQVQLITASGPLSTSYQILVDGIGSQVNVFSQQDACGISFSQGSLPNKTHTVAVSLTQSTPLQIIAVRYDDGKVGPTSSPTPQPTNKPKPAGSNNTAAIAGGVVGGILAGLALAALATWCVIRNRRKGSQAVNDNQELLATPWGATGGRPSNSHHSSGQSRRGAPSESSYYNNVTSYYPSENSRNHGNAGYSGQSAHDIYNSAGAAASAGGYPVSAGLASSIHRSVAGTLHEEDVERIAARMVQLQQAQRSQSQHDGGSSISGYNGPETPAHELPPPVPQRSAKAEYIARQQQSGPGVNRLPGGTPEEPPPAY